MQLVSGSLLQLLLLLLHTSSGELCSPRHQFIPTLLPDCISQQYVRLLQSVTNLLACSIACSSSSICKAFTFNASAGCRLMEFDKCSFNLLMPACTNRNIVYVRKISGAQPFTMCPDSYVSPPNSSWTGRKYKLTSTEGTYPAMKAVCDADEGVTKFADIEDADEAAAIDAALSLGSSEYWVAAEQLDPTAGKEVGWVWSSCNNSVAMDSSLWQSGKPNDPDNTQNAAKVQYNKLDDKPESENKLGICECVDPFHLP